MNKNRTLKRCSSPYQDWILKWFVSARIMMAYSEARICYLWSTIIVNCQTLGLWKMASGAERRQSFDFILSIGGGLAFLYGPTIRPFERGECCQQETMWNNNVFAPLPHIVLIGRRHRSWSPTNLIRHVLVVCHRCLCWDIPFSLFCQSYPFWRQK